jgi:UDP:flavonoid glycosyltransferase YjiC (YdhE family)
MRALFYAVNGLGLGHVTRLLGIARALRRLVPDVEVLFLTTSEADGVLHRERFAAVKLPSKTIREEVGLQKTRYLKLAQTVTWNTLSAFDPDVLVVDTYAMGSFEELLPALRWRQKNVFVFREQRPDAVGMPLLQATLPLYDAVIVPHASVEAVGPVPEPSKLRAVGPILVRERGEVLGRDAARRALQLPANELLVYASFGGGGEPESRRALELAAQAVSALPNAKLVVGVGPLLRDVPALPGAVLLRGVYPMMEFLPAFDAAISGTGYNSVHELLFTGVPSVFVPFERVIDDQERRALDLDARGAGRAVTSLDVAALSQALRSVLENRVAISAAAKRLVPANGAEAAARALLEVCR